MVANQLRKWRLSLDFSQQELSAVAKVSPAMIVTIERNHYLPGSHVRTKIAAALGVSEEVIWPSLAETTGVK